MLVARDLEVTLPGLREPAVRAVTLAVSPGEWVALTGPNGGGKTTLLLALAGLSPVSGGTLTLDEVPFGPRSRAGAAGGVAVVLQDPSSQLLQPTVEAELSFGARNLGLPEARIAEAVRRWSAALGLTPDLERDPATLSAGCQQMVLLAAALVPGPRLLLADEPTAHLDAATRSRVREIIAAEVARGLAVVWVTQDAGEAAAATRALALGEAAPGRVPRPCAPRARTAAPALRLRVAPDPGGEGPRIRVGRPLEIGVASPGVTALLGPNGSGKSVLLRAAAGLSSIGQVEVAWESAPAEAPIVAL